MLRRLLLFAWLTEIVAVPALADVILAAAALLALLGLVVTKYVFVPIFSHLPFIGGYVSGAVSATIDAAIDGVEGDLSELTRGTGWLFANVVTWLWRLIQSHVDVTGHAVELAVQGYRLAEQAPTLVRQALSSAEATASRLADQAVSTAEQYARAVVATAAASLGAEIVHVDTSLSQAVDTVATNLQHNLNVTDTALATEITTLAARVTTVENVVLGDVGDVVKAIELQLQGAIADAQTAANAAEAAAVARGTTIATGITATSVTALDAAAADVLNPAYDALLKALGAISIGLPATVADTLGLPGILTQAKPATLAGVLGISVAAITGVATEVADCLVPNCNTLGELNALMSLLGEAGLWAALVALLVEAATHPSGAVDDIMSTLVPVVHGAASAFRGLIGV